MIGKESKRPIIGLTPMYDAENERYSLRGDYMQMLCQLGAIPVMMPLTLDREILDHFLAHCDGIVLSGGNDIAPERYGRINGGLCGRILPERDEMELYLCRQAVERDLPVLGICRGHQVMNVALGGTLYQDLKTEMGTELQHQVPQSAGDFAHAVSLVPGTPLACLQGTETMEANSRHHQAVRELAPGLEVQATAPDGVIESFWMPGKRFVWGVQWHPESIWSINGPNRKITEAFLSAAGGK